MNLDGIIESLTKTVPVLHVPKLTVFAYTESGDLICDVENRVYLTMVNEKNIAVNTIGRLENLQGALIAEVNLQHDGRGRIEGLIPRKGERYQFHSLKSPQQNSAEFIYHLPLSCVEGIRMQLVDQGSSGSLSVSLYSKTVYTVKVTL